MIFELNECNDIINEKESEIKRLIDELNKCSDTIEKNNAMLIGMEKELKDKDQAMSTLESDAHNQSLRNTVQDMETKLLMLENEVRDRKASSSANEYNLTGDNSAITSIRNNMVSIEDKIRNEETEIEHQQEVEKNLIQKLSNQRQTNEEIVTNLKILEGKVSNTEKALVQLDAYVKLRNEENEQLMQNLSEQILKNGMFRTFIYFQIVSLTKHLLNQIRVSD